MKKCARCGELIGDSVTGNCPICLKPATRINDKGKIEITNEEIMNVVKPAICSKLKSPASAQFPVDLISIVGDSDRGYRVSGFVDSQNSYGALIRNDFEATVDVQNGFPVVKTSSVAAKANAQRAAEFGTNYLASIIFTVIGAAIIYFLISMLIGF